MKFWSSSLYKYISVVYPSRSCTCSLRIISISGGRGAASPLPLRQTLRQAMAPQPPLSPANGDGDGDSIVDRDVWLACAIPLSRLPTVGAEVYYFPYGHAEQCPAHLPAPLPAPHLFPCTVTHVALGADDTTNEVFAKISLSSGPHRGAAAASSHREDVKELSYFTKELTQSDANNGGGFSVPRYCADHIFPPLDFQADPPVQNLVMRDTGGNPWQFRHIYRGTPRRHLLTTGWSRFVNAKLLVAGDIVVFMRRANGDLVVGLRRAPRYPLVFPGAADPEPDHQPAPPPRNARARVPPQDVVEAARRAAEGRPFTVTYFPRQAAGEFVVPRAEVEAALATRWEPGTQVRIKVMEAEDTRRIVWADGHVKTLHQNIWRALEIDWDDSSPLSLKLSRFVNAWQVQLVAHPPLPNRARICDPVAPLCPGEVSYPLIGSETQPMAMTLGPPIPAGMQGARHTGPSSSESSAMLTTQLLFPLTNRDLRMPPLTSPSASSEILDPEAAASPNNSVGMRPAELPVQVKSIQLFGATITPHVVQSVTDGGPEVVIGGPNDDAIC